MDCSCTSWSEWAGARPPHQGPEHPASFVGEPKGIGIFLAAEVANSAGDAKERLQFKQRASRDAEMARVVAAGHHAPTRTTPILP